MIDVPNTAAESGTGFDDLEDQLTACVQHFEEAENSGREARELSVRDRWYYDNEQWTPEELSILRKRKQPPLTINYIKKKVEVLRGYERKVRSDPKAFPRTPTEEARADAATDSLRFVADQNDYDEIRSNIYENLLIEGTGGVDVVVEQTKIGDYKIVYKRIPWDRLFWDPHSYEKDFSDANYKGIVIWMDRSEAEDKWPDARDAIENTCSGGGSSAFSEVYEDKPRFQIWTDSRRKRVRIVQIHYKWRGEWLVATYTKGGFLEEPVKSPYLDKDGDSCSSLIMRSAYIDQENNRYGDVRSLISLQDEINKRRSKALHLMSVRQTFGDKTAIADTQAAKNELAKPDGHVETNAGAEFGKNFGILPTGDMAQGQVLLMQQAVQEMQASGPNPALAGKDTSLRSGRAIQAQQQGGAVEIEPGLDDLKQFSRDIYEATWSRIKQFWTAEKWVRVTDDERNLKWVGLNKPVTMEQKIAQQLEQVPPEAQEQAMAEIMAMNGIQSPYDPRLKQVVETENSVSDLDVDIVIEEGPDIASLQSEQFEILAGLAQSGMQIPAEVIIMASSLRNKDALIEKIEKAQQQQAQAQQQAAQQAGQLAQEKAQSEAQNKSAQSQKYLAEAEGTEIDNAAKAQSLLNPMVM